MVFGIGKNAIVTDLCDVGFARGECSWIKNGGCCTNFLSINDVGKEGNFGCHVLRLFDDISM